MKILVTGANGYIGSRVVKKLLDSGNEVIATDIHDEHIDTRATVIKENIFGDINFYELFQKPDICLHMAWRDGFVHHSENHILDLSSHFRFLKNLIDSGISQIAVMGTMHEAGYFEGKMSDLTYTNPQSLYGVAKDCLRRSLSLYCAGKDVVFQWLRAFYIYGADDFGNSVFCKLRQAVKEGKQTFPFTTGKNQYDFIHIEDLVNQIVLAVLQREIAGEINVCSGKPVSLADQIEWYIRENDLPIQLDYGKYPDRPYDSPCVYGDTMKIHKIMGDLK